MLFPFLPFRFGAGTRPRGPYYFAWVDSTETSFGPQHYRVDEAIFSATKDHGEGNIPTLTLEIANPRRGLLSGKVWAWFSHDTGGTLGVVPLFFGRLVGIPTNIFAEVVTITLIAQPLDYLDQKQAVAETLKVRPNYDPIFLDAAHRDDPDAILEGYSALWHVDPVTHAVTVSDIINGEDGEIVFEESDAFYDSVSMSMGQAPLNGVNVDATVAWTQSASGTVDIGERTFFSYAGQSLMIEWPKPAQSLGSGWSCLSGIAVDTYGIATASMFTSSYQWKNNDSSHTPGDTMSISASQSVPLLNAGAASLPLTSQQIASDLPIDTETGCIKQALVTRSQGAVIDPNDPDFHDITTAYSETTYLYIPYWRVDTSLVLRYDASRQRSEHLVFTLMANLQPVLTPPQSPPLPVEETIRISGADVSQPLANVLDWLSVKGQAVAVGQVIYPDNPTVIGGTSYQICFGAGTCGTGAVPNFSNIPGTETNDNGVIWVSLGESLTNNAGDWQANTYYPTGSIIRPLAPVWATWASLVPPPRIVGSAISLGQICQDKNGNYHVCLYPGTTGLSEPEFGSTYGAETTDYTVTWVCIGSSLPTGTIYFIATNSGTSAEVVRPFFDNTVGNTTSDNGIVWKSLGTAGTFIDVPIGDVSRRSYFPTDRGLWSIEYLICLAAAKLRHRARCVESSWEGRFEKIYPITCRNNARLYDHRFPGGTISGKVTRCGFTIDGDRASATGKITIGAAVGYGNSVSPVTGTPTYVAEGYVQPGYQYYDGGTTPIVGSTVGYSTPVDAPDDDGLVFPLTRAQAVAREAVWGTVNDQLTAIKEEMPNVILQATIEAGLRIPGDPNPLYLPSEQLKRQLIVTALSRSSIETKLAAAPIWYDLELKPVTNGPFNSEYQIVVTNLEVPQQINLEAAGSP